MVANQLLKRLLIDNAGQWRNLYYILLAHPQSLMVRNIVENIAANASEILDVGARKSPYTKRLKGQVVLLDKQTESDGYLGFTNQLADNLSRLHNREVVWGDITAMPFGENSFDIVLCVEVIEHIKEDEKAISQIAKVLKDDGHAIFTTPNGTIVPNVNPYHIRHYSPKLFSETLKKHFDKVEVWTKCPWHKWSNMLNQRLRSFEEKKSTINFLVYSVLRFSYILLSVVMPKILRIPGSVIVAKVSKPR